MRAPGNEPLSTREREVLALVAEGDIYGKPGVKDRAAAVATAYGRGILS